jgi:hypothetical protein
MIVRTNKSYPTWNPTHLQSEKTAVPADLLLPAIRCAKPGDHFGGVPGFSGSMSNDQESPGWTACL